MEDTDQLHNGGGGGGGGGGGTKAVGTNELDVNNSMEEVQSGRTELLLLLQAHLYIWNCGTAINGYSGSPTAGSANTGDGADGIGIRNEEQVCLRIGVVILRVPTDSYSGTTGSPTVSTDGTDTIIKFTSSEHTQHNLVSL